MRVVGGLKVVFKLKKNVICSGINQAIVEIILANALSAYAVLIVLTDLKNDWHFFWLQEFKITEIVVYDIREAITIIECAVATEETQGPKAPPFAKRLRLDEAQGNVSNYENLIEQIRNRHSIDWVDDCDDDNDIAPMHDVFNVMSPEEIRSWRLKKSFDEQSLV